jgi:hypothetical protein
MAAGHSEARRSSPSGLTIYPARQSEYPVAQWEPEYYKGKVGNKPILTNKVVKYHKSKCTVCV